MQRNEQHNRQYCVLPHCRVYSLQLHKEHVGAAEERCDPAKHPTSDQEHQMSHLRINGARMVGVPP